MQFAAVVLLLAVAVATTGCDTTKRQDVVVVLSSGSEPVPSTTVRLYATQDCAGSFQVAITSASGEVRFVRTVEMGGIDVITDEISLCIPSGSSWRQVYGSLHGPAPSLIELSCDLTSVKSKCTEHFDGRLIQDAIADEHDT